jgi:serine/threonine-protein kinase
LLKQVAERQYCFAVELLRQWIRRNKPLRDVKDTMSWVRPVQTQVSSTPSPASTLVLASTPPPSPPKWPLDPGDQIGRYKIESERGSGAMGIVYKAYDPNISRFVALKVLRSMAGPGAKELEERFRREAQAAGKLEHPNIVTVYDADVAEGQWYIVMEYLEGKTLAEIVAEKGPRPLEWVTSIVVQTCAALNYAHEHQVIHRDVKPSNIMILEDDRVKMTDFGLASLTADSDLTKADVFLGTPCYMSPEQIREPKQVDGRSDIFALGVVVYELLMGEMLFSDKHITLIYHIISPEPVDLSNLSASLPDSIHQVLEKALAKDANERFSTCAEFSEAFVRAARQGS